jgi:aspartate aminotransferase-like enzyme
LAHLTQQWVQSHDLSLLPEPGFSSYTVTTVRNTRGIDIAALNQYLKSHGMQISNGYGKLKDKTFRIAHMGDVTRAEMEELLGCMTAYLEEKQRIQ